MSEHLNDEKLIGYVHYTLTDAGREAMDEHLGACPDCRARLAEYEALQRRIRYSLAGDIKAASPPLGMTFAAVAPRLHRHSWWDRLRVPSGELLPGTLAFAALAGLTAALVGLLQSLGWGSARLTAVSESRLPLLACGCFAVTVVANYKWKSSLPPRLVLSRMLAFTLWIGTAIVGLQVIVAALDMVIWLLYLVVSPSVAPVGVWASIPLSIAWIAVVVGGGEYHYRWLGQRNSWRLFGWTIAAELFILVLSQLFVSWFSVPHIVH